MEKSNLNSELFGATNLFNNLTKGFREGVELKNHNRRLKSYKNCFIAHKGVSFLFNLLKSKNEFADKIQHRDQVINLMDIFLRWGIIKKIYPSTNLNKFQDNKDLYTLGSDDDDRKETQSSYGHIRSNISKSTNDLLNNTFNKSIRENRSSVYRSFRSSTYDQLNQIQVSIKKTTSTIIKSTNHNMTKLANHTFNKFNNRSGNNLIKKLNSNFNKSSNNSIKRSTSVLAKNNPSFMNRKLTRSASIQQEKENLIANKKFERNYRNHVTRTHTNLSVNNNFSLNNASINSLPIHNQIAMPTFDRNLSTSLNLPSNDNQKVSLNPMDINRALCPKYVETEGNNLIRFLTKLSDGLKKKPLKPVNTSNCNSLSSSNNSSQIILKRDQVQYIPSIISIPNIQHLQSIKPPHATNRQSNFNFNNNRFDRTCLSNPISSTCYNTLV